MKIIVLLDATPCRLVDIYQQLCELERQHNKRKDIFKVETK
jgi:hypothetical protein